MCTFITVEIVVPNADWLQCVLGKRAFALCAIVVFIDKAESFFVFIAVMQKFLLNL